MDQVFPPDQSPNIEAGPHFNDDRAAEVQAWEQIEAGRYMPRRFKGSYKGRALG